MGHGPNLIPTDVIDVPPLPAKPAKRSAPLYRGDAPLPLGINVTHPGKVILYVEAEIGPTEWRITSGPHTDLIGAFGRFTAKNAIHSFLLDGTTIDAPRLASERNDCPTYPPISANRLGPAILHLDEIPKMPLERGIDALIRQAAIDQGGGIARLSIA